MFRSLLETGWTYFLKKVKVNEHIFLCRCWFFSLFYSSYCFLFYLLPILSSSPLLIWSFQNAIYKSIFFSMITIFYGSLFINTTIFFFSLFHISETQSFQWFSCSSFIIWSRSSIIKLAGRPDLNLITNNWQIWSIRPLPNCWDKS